MKKLALALMLVAALLATTALSALADGRPLILRIPQSSTLTNPCNGEVIELSGTFQIVIHETMDSSGGSHFIIEGNAQGVSGVSTTGTRYRVTGGFWDEFNSGPDRGAVSNSVGVLNILSQGTAPNFLEHATLKVSFNANGEPTAEVVHEFAECRG